MFPCLLSSREGTETHVVLDSGWQQSFLLNLLVLQGHPLRPLLKSLNTTKLPVRDEDAVLSEAECLALTCAQGSVWREGLTSPLLHSTQWASIFPCTVCIHSLYLGQYLSEPISLGGHVPNGSALNLGLQSPSPHHIG